MSDLTFLPKGIQKGEGLRRGEVEVGLGVEAVPWAT